MKKLLILVFGFLIVSCSDTIDYDNIIKANSEKVFGVSFPSSQDWITTTKMSTNIELGNYDKAFILASFKDSELKVLNSTKENGIIYFDVPDNYKNLYVVYLDKEGKYLYENIDKTTTRALSQNYQIPSNVPVINKALESFSNQRGWIPGEYLYIFNYQYINSNDYNSDFKNIFRDIVFNYFPNGKKYDNLPKIKKSGYYNESVYPITTGDEPIIISPIYKNDGGYHEISDADLYYYYFKGNLSVSEIESLPKYKAIQLDDIYTNEENDTIYKSKSYVLAYFGDNIPEIGTEGTYQFPSGYKIGFMYQSKTNYEKPKKQGELYGDGRLNYNINNWGNFKSSNLKNTDPRMAWMSVNGKMYLCIESGTDRDFNDLIVEVEGGIEPIEIIPDEPESQFYTFCYEDSKLGDYDMNDVVIKGRRIDERTVEWTLMACGAFDRLYIKGINGKQIKDNIEVHNIFNKDGFVNTTIGDNTPYIIDTIKVDKDFSFLINQPFIYDLSKNWNVEIARRGENPHAIMIPYDFKWSLEKICIKDSYLQFNNWGMKLIEDTDWYKYPVENKIYNF